MWDHIVSFWRYYAELVYRSSADSIDLLGGAWAILWGFLLYGLVCWFLHHIIKERKLAKEEMKVFLASAVVTVFMFGVFLLINMVLTPVRLAKEKETEFSRRINELTEEKQIEIDSLREVLTHRERRITELEADRDTLNQRIEELINASARKHTAPRPEVSGVRYSTERVSSPDSSAPYGLRVTLQTNAKIQPVSLTICCTGRIADYKTYSGVMYGVSEGIDGKCLRLSFEGPEWTPQKPIVLDLFASEAIDVEKVSL